MAADQLTLQESLAASRRIGGLTLRYALCFYLLIPLAVGLNQGWFQAGLARYLPLKLSILLWCGNWAAYWWACELGTRAIAPIVRPWRLAPTAVLLLGSLLATLMSPLYFGLFGQLFMGYLPANVVIPSEADDLPNILSSFRVFELFASGAGGTLMWVLANSFFDRYLGLPRFRSLGILRRLPPRVWREPQPPPDEGLIAPVSPPPAFVARLTRIAPPTAQTLLAIEAQEHYVKVHTEHGSELIYYRFGDALRDLQTWPGLQVHRSFWVTRAAVARIEHSDRRTRLVLRNKELVPVGASFLALVRQAGFPT